MDSIITFENVSKDFKVGDATVVAVKELSFSINPGEFVVIVGPSGAGKTTMLNLLGGMDTISTGKITVSGEVISNYTPKQLTLYRRHTVGFIFQFYNLMPNLTAIENVELATEICDEPLDPASVLEDVGLAERKNYFPSQLSGGEQQRVSIARALAKNPKIILCDEPTGALDYETGKKVLKLLKEISENKEKTVIIVTHNSALKEMAHKVIMVKNGQVGSIILNDKPKSIEEIEW